jgi:ABC-type antimicrobial peptide transport system permease subunit
VLHILGERNKEFGIMKSVGFRERDIQREMLTETFLQTLAGFVGGFAISVVAIAVLARTSVSISRPWELSPYPHFLLSDPNMANVVQSHLLPIRPEPLYIGITLIISLIIGLIVSFMSVWHISRLKPMEILRYE